MAETHMQQGSCVLKKRHSCAGKMVKHGETHGTLKGRDDEISLNDGMVYTNIIIYDILTLIIVERVPGHSFQDKCFF